MTYTLCCAPVQVIITCLVEPGYFREVHSFVQQSSEGQGRLEVVSLAAIDDTDSNATFEMSTPQLLQPQSANNAANATDTTAEADGSNAEIEAATVSRSA